MVQVLRKSEKLMERLSVKARGLMWFSNLVSVFADMKMKWKVLVSYITLSLIPIIFLSLFTYQYVRYILVASETRLISDTINQVALSINYQVQFFDAMSDYLFNDNEIIRLVNTSYGDRYFLMWKALTDHVLPTFRTYKALHADLTRLTIYTGSDLHRFGNYVLPFDHLVENHWYTLVQNSIQPVWFVTEDEYGKSLHSVRRLVSHGWEDMVNYLYMEFDYDSFFAPLDGVSDYGVIIVDSRGIPIFTSDTTPCLVMSFDFSQGYLTELQADFQIISSELSHNAWTIYYFVPLGHVSESVTNVIQAIFFVFLFALVLIGVLAWLFSGILITPLEALTKNIQQVQLGELTVTVATKRNDEIGILIRSFVGMIEQIKHLFDVVYRNELEKKEYQFAMLRAQINPHFLYNSLSLINSRAIVSGEDEISQMVLLISSFFRTALNNGKEMTIVENELNNIKSYISIQELLHNYEFDVEYRLDDKAMNLEMPNFILQPLVENAIGHGLMNSQKTDRLLIVETSTEDKSISLIITDNGKGMDKDQVESLLNNQGTGYGVKNINERLQLLYGDQNSIEIESSLGLGTKITIRIPLA